MFIPKKLVFLPKLKLKVQWKKQKKVKMAKKGKNLLI